MINVIFRELSDKIKAFQLLQIMSLFLINTLWFISFFMCRFAAALDKGEQTQPYPPDTYFKMVYWLLDRELPPASLQGE